MITWLSADGHAFDLQGNHQALLQGNAGYSAGVSGSAFQLDGINDALDLGTWFNLQTFTIAFWVNEGDTQNGAADLIDNNHTCCRGFVIQNYQQPLHEYTYGLTGTGRGFTFRLQPGVWQHIVLTRSAEGLARIYLDGVIIGEIQAAPVIYDGSEFLRIGRWGGGGRHWKGLVDEVSIYGRDLTPDEVVGLYGAKGLGVCRDQLSVPACELPPVGLVAAWSGENTALDLIHDRVATLATNSSYAPGLKGDAFRFAGGNALGAVSEKPLTELTNSFTIEFWAWPGADRAGTPEANSGISGTFGQRYAIGAEHAGDDGQRAAVGVSVGSNGVSVFEHAASYMPSPLVFDTPIRGWTHVAVVYDDRTPRLYLNGTLVRTGLKSTRSVVYPSQYFGDVSAGYGPYVGLLDEVAIYNRALGAAEVAAIANARGIGICEPAFEPEGLALWLRADAGVTRDASDRVSVWSDQSGGAHHGSSTQPPQFVPAVLNDKPVLRFGHDGDHFFEIDGSLLPGQEFTFVAVANQTGGGGGHRELLSNWTPGNMLGSVFLGLTGDDSTRVRFTDNYGGGEQGNSGAGVLSEPARHFIFTGVSRASSVSVYQNRKEIARRESPLSPRNLSTGFVVGRQGALPGEYWRGDIAEVLVFDRVLDDAELSRVWSDLEYKYFAIPRGAPDLQVTDIVAPPQATLGQPITISVTVRNAGAGPANGRWQNTLLHSVGSSEANAQTFGTFEFNGLLAAGASITLTQRVLLPAAALGARFLGVRANGAGQLVETSTNNNSGFALTATTLVAPDLGVEGLSVPGSAIFGESFPVTWRVRNAGTSATTTAWRDELFLSASATSVLGAIPLGAAPSTPLAAGASYLRTIDVSPPLLTTLPAGSYFIMVVADHDQAQAEGAEDNNRAAAPIALSPPPLPDLALQGVQAPDAAIPGLSSTISWIVTNRGAATATGTWIEVVSLVDAAGERQRLAEFSVSSPLAVGGSVKRTQMVPVPLNLLAGDRRFVVEVDDRNQVVESNEDNNAVTSSTISRVPAELKLSLPATELLEGTPAVIATVTRNGDRSVPLLVTLSNSAPTQLEGPAQVTIPVGAASVEFPIRATADGRVDGQALVTLEASGAGYRSAAIALTVRDVDLPALRLTLPAPSVGEGLSLRLTVTRDYGLERALSVVLNSGDPAQLTVPTSVSFLAGQTSVQFLAEAVDDTLIEPQQTHQVRALAPGFREAIAAMAVIDNDLPQLTLSLALGTVSEGAGPQATSATITRQPVSSRPLLLTLVSSDPGTAMLPASVTLPGGHASISFPVAVVDDPVVDGTVEVQLQVRVNDVDGNVVSEVVQTLRVLDDDGPTLKLDIDRDLAAEGLQPAARATITRNTATDTALAVTLTSSDSGEATVPVNVTIPAGAAAASVDLVTPLDGLTDGNQSVSLTASAAGFTPGVDTMVVSDIDLPDLVFSRVSVPDQGVTDSAVAVGFRVENRGIAASPAGFAVRALLSTDALVGGDSELGTQVFDRALEVGASIEQTSQFKLPGKAGRYWLILVADAAGQVDEVLENNNTFITALPVEVLPAYSATVQTPVTTAFAGTPVPLSGTAVRLGSGLPAVHVPVAIHLLLRGTERVLLASTDANGNFTTTFVPLPGEAGHYEIGAAYPGAEAAAVQDRFTLLGLRLEAPTLALPVIEGGAATSVLQVVNLGDAPVSQLSATVVSAPPNVEVQLQLAAPTLGALASTGLQVIVRATNATPSTGEVRLRVAGSDGLVTEAVLGVRVTALAARLISTPESLVATMVPGRQSSIEFEIENVGGRASDSLTVSIPSTPWLRVGTANPLPPLAPGARHRVSLLLTPSPELALGPYSGSVVVGDGAAARLNLPFAVRAASEARGELRVSAVDEFTYYATGAPKVGRAAVTLRDPFTRETIAEAVTDASGVAAIPSLPEGYYQIELRAEAHSPFAGTVFVRGGQTNDFEGFLSRQTVTYRWSVVPATIEDRTRITLETTFETFVPVPVITLEPALIDLADFSGAVTQINLTIQNHGLVAAQEFKLNFPTHPDVEFIPLITDFGTLPAQSKLSVPLTIRRRTGGLAARAAPAAVPSPCSLAATACWTLPCGARKNTYCAGITAINVAADCLTKVPPLSLPSLPATSSAWTQVPPPYIDYGGQAGTYQILDTPSPFLPPLSFEPPQLCDCDPNAYEPKCLEIPIESSILNAGLTAVATALKKIPRLELEDPKADVKVQVCTCCDDDGVGLKVAGGAAVTFKGKVAFGPDLAFKETFSAHGFDVEAEIVLRCAADFPFEIGASVDGKTACHFKDLEVCGRASVDLPFALICEAGVKYTLMKDGQKLGEQFDTKNVSLDYGFSGAFQYCRDAKGVRTEGEICGKGLTLRGTWDVNLAGARFTLGFTNELVAGNCLQFGQGSELSRDVIDAVEPGFQAAVEAQGRLARLAGMSPSARANSPATGAPAVVASADDGGLCAKVKLRLDQDFVMARQAFNATLELENRSPGSSLTNIAVSIFVVDELGQDVSERFGVRPPTLSGITALASGGQIDANSSGTASWILVPTSEAAPLQPTRYGVGGVLTYWQDGNEVTIPLFPAPITVFPDPRLSVKYFHERDVFGDDPFTRDILEPGVPFNLAVLVQNRGGGPARDVRLVSGQPRIVENEKGLVIDFQIIGTEVAGQPQSPSLTATFGEIPPGTNAIARWLMTSTLQGLFTDYRATFEHQDSLGKTNLSLIDSVSIHEMIHLVHAPGPFNDGRPDFLVNDVRDGEDLPDTLHLSDGRTQGVEVVRTATVDGPPHAGDLVLELTTSMPPGWGYLRVPDPANGQFQLVRVRRSDGREILLGTNVWTTDRTFIGQSQRPRSEHTLHLLDHDSTGRYTLEYAPQPAVDITAPTSAVEALPAGSYPQFLVSWQGDDGSGSGLAAFDVYVSEDDGAFQPWLRNTPLRSSIYQGQAGRRYAFYTLAVDQRGNREAIPGGPDAQTTINKSNTPPTVDLPADVTIDEGQTFRLAIGAGDLDADQSLTFELVAGAPVGLQLNPRTGELSWPTGEGNGPSTNQIRVRVSDNGEPPLSITGAVQVIVRELNSAPVVAAVADRKIAELQTLALNLAATDPDLPAQRLTYLLAPGAPAGASLDAATGVFTWIPTVLQGPSTNQIGFIVRDNGEPSLSATQTFTVIVRDSRADFTVSLGSAVVPAGLASSVPIQLLSGLDLNSITFMVNLSAAALQDLAVAPSSPTVGSTTLSAAGANRYELRFAAAAGDLLETASELARLHFVTDTNIPSALVYLGVDGIRGVRTTGEAATRGSGNAGRVIVVNREPILEAVRGEPRALTLYGQPGASFAIERTLELGSQRWEAAFPHAQETLADRIEIGGAAPFAFYRAIRFEANPPRLVSDSGRGMILFGEPGKEYWIESTTSREGFPVWDPVESVTLINSWQIVRPIERDGFPIQFRVVEPAPTWER